MRGKHIESKPGGENAVPHPHDKDELGPPGTRHGTHKRSPDTAAEGANHRQTTPDKMGTLFDHKPNKHGV